MKAVDPTLPLRQSTSAALSNRVSGHVWDYVHFGAFSVVARLTGNIFGALERAWMFSRRDP